MADFEVPIEFVTELAKDAGDIIFSKMFIRDKKLNSKLSLGDLVTETDVAVEKFIYDRIQARFPHHKFLGEESAGTGERISDEPTWIIDPIDGTTNFVHTFPFACVSIGFVRQKEPIIGVVYNPTLKEMFVGQKGLGATLNGERISTSGINNLSNSLVSIGLAIHIIRKLEKPELLSEEEKNFLLHRKSQVLKFTSILMEKVHDLRRIGSCALDICHVAMGRQEIYFEMGPYEWDMAAGLCILKEAGGYYADFDGGKLELHSRRVAVAATKELHDELVSEVFSKIEWQS